MIHEGGFLESFDFKSLLLSSTYPFDTFQSLRLVSN